MIATNKNELIEDISKSFNKLFKELESVPYNKVLDKTMEGQIKNTKMSLHNLLSYLVGWGELMLKRNNIYNNENKIPDLPDTGYKMNDWGKIAEKFYGDYEKYGYEKLLIKFKEVVGEIIKFIDNSDNKVIYGDNWYITNSSGKGYTFGRMIALNTSSPYKNAYLRIRKWKNNI